MPRARMNWRGAFFRLRGMEWFADTVRTQEKSLVSAASVFFIDSCILRFLVPVRGFEPLTY